MHLFAVGSDSINNRCAVPPGDYLVPESASEAEARHGGAEEGR